MEVVISVCIKSNEDSIFALIVVSSGENNRIVHRFTLKKSGYPPYYKGLAD